MFAIASATTDVTMWRRPGTGPLPFFSLAAWWEVLVSFPILLALIIGWFWRIFLWTRFLWLVSRMNLKLVLTHPDRSAGLGFVAYSVRAFSAVAIGFGVIVAGSSAEAVVHHGHSVYELRHTVLVLVAFVLAFCCAPLFVFTRKLVEAWRRGISQYGAATAVVGRKFEQKLLDERRSDASSAPDVSATNDLFQLAERIYDMKLVPIDLKGLIFLVVVTLVPFVPIVAVALPFDVVLGKLTEILF